MQSLLLAMRMGYLAQATLSVYIYIVADGLLTGVTFDMRRMCESVFVYKLYIDNNYIAYFCSFNKNVSVKDDSVCVCV